MANTKPKLIPLSELRALCKEAGVEIFVDNMLTEYWGIYHNRSWIFTIDKTSVVWRRTLKAYCLGLIAMRERGEL